MTLNPRENPYAPRQNKEKTGVLKSSPTKDHEAQVLIQNRERSNRPEIVKNKDAKVKLASLLSNPPVDIQEDKLLRERDKFLSLCIRSPFYTNPSFPEPWSVFRQLSEEITDEVVATVEDEFSEGLNNFVEDFLRTETEL